MGSKTHGEPQNCKTCQELDRGRQSPPLVREPIMYWCRHDGVNAAARRLLRGKPVFDEGLVCGGVQREAAPHPPCDGRLQFRDGVSGTGKAPREIALPSAASPAATYAPAAISSCPQARSSPGSGTEQPGFHSGNTNSFLLHPSQIPGARRPAGHSGGFHKKGNQHLM